MLDILKDFALVNRYEYVPFCPICGVFFKTSSEIMILDCRHFFCKICLTYLSHEGQFMCPFDQGNTPQPVQGDALGEAVQFLSEWSLYLQGADQGRKEETVDRLMVEIVMIRKHLNYRNVPCRVTTTGVRCVCNFGCLSDHSLAYFEKKECPHSGCRNENCMFIHKAKLEPVKTRQEINPVPQKTGSKAVSKVAKKQQKESGCCSLS